MFTDFISVQMLSLLAAVEPFTANPAVDTFGAIKAKTSSIVIVVVVVGIFIALYSLLNKKQNMAKENSQEFLKVVEKEVLASTKEEQNAQVAAQKATTAFNSLEQFNEKELENISNDVKSLKWDITVSRNMPNTPNK